MEKRKQKKKEQEILSENEFYDKICEATEEDIVNGVCSICGAEVYF